MTRPRLLIPTVAAATALLLWFARWFDFQCDDAFIAFRYAANWVAHGEIVYNVGERVEGYTSFSWVALLALLHRVGMPLPTAAKTLGSVSGLLLLVLTAEYAKRLMPERAFGAALLLAMVAGNACIAAWTLAGLETPLFAALVVGCVVAVADWLNQPTFRRASRAAAILFVATLTRPEAAILAICAGTSVLFLVLQRRQWPRGILALVVGYCLAFSGYLLWRHSYYGDFLPNTFYVKTTGESGALLARGLDYLQFSATEFGLPLVVAVAVLAFLPLREDARGPVGRRFAVITSRLYSLTMLVYVARIGGDFLDLYRFLVPILPLVFGLALRRALVLFESAPTLLRPRWVRGGIALAFLFWYGHHQWVLAQRAMQTSEVGRREHGIEPLGWTATYARRWAATGRWLAAHSKPGDWLAVGAAGAMPYYSGLPNIDTFGLCDRTVAREGTIIGARPGHQRFARIDYLLRRAPTFLLINDYALDEPARFGEDPSWEQRGYIWVEAHVEREAHHTPTGFYHYFLVRRERAVELVGAPRTRVAAQ